MLITEQIEVGNLEGLAKMALMNAKNVANDSRIVKQECRIVNGNKMIYLEMRGSTEGADFTYRGYYSSGKRGTAQLVTCTGSALVDKYAAQINDFLNDFGVQP